MTKNEITTLFCDIGGVLLTNGWDHRSRMKAADHFKFNFLEFDSRHQLCFYLYEIGEITLKEYLEETLFYQSRPFTMEKFIDFMYAQSEPADEMISYVKELKSKYNLTVLLLSNEGKELADYRTRKFAMHDFADIFVISAYVHVRKPDKKIFQMAVDLVQRPPESIVYIDDRQLFIDIAAKMGIHSIRHTDGKATRKAFESLIF